MTQLTLQIKTLATTICYSTKNHLFKIHSMKATLTGTDLIINECDKALRAIFTKPKGTRSTPQPNSKPEEELSDFEVKQSIELMRINHTGEVCAQALYQGQAITARSTSVKEKMHEAASEEIDHLQWCETRLEELGGRPSLLNPVWYAGSLTLGTIAGILGDKWSLGFLQETEIQVEKHLGDHLEKLPENDKASRAIVKQMQIDEAQHAQMAKENGAAELPLIAKRIMTSTANIMKTVVAKI